MADDYKTRIDILYGAPLYRPQLALGLGSFGGPITTTAIPPECYTQAYQAQALQQQQALMQAQQAMQLSSLSNELLSSMSMEEYAQYRTTQAFIPTPSIAAEPIPPVVVPRGPSAIAARARGLDLKPKDKT